MAITILSADNAILRSGDFYIYNNIWGSGSLLNGIGYTQSISVDLANITNSLTIQWNWPWGDGSIVAYPEIGWGSSPLYEGYEECQDYISTISQLGTFAVDVDVDVTAGSVYGNVAFDMWLTETPFGGTAQINTEVMVWLDKNSVGAYGNKVGTLGSGADTASIYYKAGVGSAADYIAVIYDQPHLEGRIDLKAILQALGTRGLLQTDDYISGYEFGTELTGSSGSVAIKQLSTTFQTTSLTAGVAKAGGTGNDSIFGYNGNDTLRGYGGNDTINGGAGNDIIEGGAGADKLNGGSGVDTLEYRTSNAGVYVDLVNHYVGDGHAAGDWVMNFENATGSEYNDGLTGTSGANVLMGLGGTDVLTGNGGSDNLVGGDGNDYIYGGDGADRITGSSGVDVLRGDAGGDWFVFGAGHSVPGQMDDILDFSFAQGDRIDLSGMDADILAAGLQDFKFIGKAEFSGVSGELRYVKTATDTFIYADTNGNKVVDLAINLEGAIDLTATAFVF